MNNESVFYSRLNEQGEYKYVNRLDTLFVLQLSFIIILIYIGLYYLNIFGLFSKASMYIVITLLFVVFVLVLLNKAVVMANLRRKTENKFNFGDGKEAPTSVYKNGGVDGGSPGSIPNSNCRTETVCTPGLQI